MTLTAERDIESVRRGFGRWLQAHRGATLADVHDLVRPSVGWSAETFVARLGDGERMVVRMPPLGDGLFPAYDLMAQGQVQDALGRADLPVPAPVAFEADGRWLGAPFLVMPYVAGHIPGQVPTADPWIMDATVEQQRALCFELLDTLAVLHRFDWRGAGLGDVLRGRGGSLVDELEWWGAYLDWAFSGDPPATLVSSLAWCREHRRGTEPAPSLLWGDARLGNVIFDDEPRAVAVLDWEMATIGPAEMDLAWYLALDAAQRELMGTVPGFPDRAEMIRRYESGLGRAVCELEWHEIFALVRSNAIMFRIGVLFESAGGQSIPIDDNPMVALVERRIVEATSTFG